MPTLTQAFVRVSMTSGSLNVDARSTMTLFQPQPSGLPSIDQMKIGFFSFAA